MKLNIMQLQNYSPSVFSINKASRYNKIKQNLYKFYNNNTITISHGHIDVY